MVKIKTKTEITFIILHLSVIRRNKNARNIPWWFASYMRDACLNLTLNRSRDRKGRQGLLPVVCVRSPKQGKGHRKRMLDCDWWTQTSQLDQHQSSSYPLLWLATSTHSGAVLSSGSCITGQDLGLWDQDKVMGSCQAAGFLTPSL